MSAPILMTINAVIRVNDYLLVSLSLSVESNLLLCTWARSRSPRIASWTPRYTSNRIGKRGRMFYRGSIKILPPKHLIMTNLEGNVQFQRALGIAIHRYEIITDIPTP